MIKNELRTEIILNTPPAAVWKELTHLSAWSAWNPFIVKAKGTLKVGCTLENTFMNKGKPMVIKPKVIHVQDQQKFAWQGSALMGGFKGEHYFILEPLTPNQTKLIQGEKFTGWLVWLILPLIKEQTHRGFIAMNRALKTRLESKF